MSGPCVPLERPDGSFVRVQTLNGQPLDAVARRRINTIIDAVIAQAEQEQEAARLDPNHVHRWPVRGNQPCKCGKERSV